MDSLKEAAFGAGCFWGVEKRYNQINGVKETEVGFMGGNVPNVSYDRVCEGDTGHTEVVHLWYNPKEVSYKELLQAFWNMHNPTEYHRQGPDVGEQYRSVIFYYDDEQRKDAEQSKDELLASGKYETEIVTEITRAGPFYRAEEYHQKYLDKQKGFGLISLILGIAIIVLLSAGLLYSVQSRRGIINSPEDAKTIIRTAEDLKNNIENRNNNLLDN